jgi:uncharacterized protein (TIGR02284 family)
MSTTATQQTSPHADPKAIIYVLNKCIETCSDGERGYGVAAANVREPWLKTLFQRRSTERADFVVGLQFAIEKLGAFPENEGTAKGLVHRAWMDARLVLQGRADLWIVEECVRGEEAALKAYDESFSRTALEAMPAHLRTMLQLQYEAIQAGLNEARRQLTLVH